jgi:hypothetical protein
MPWWSRQVIGDRTNTSSIPASSTEAAVVDRLGFGDLAVGLGADLVWRRQTDAQGTEIPCFQRLISSPISVLITIHHFSHNDLCHAVRQARGTARSLFSHVPWSRVCSGAGILRPHLSCAGRSRSPTHPACGAYASQLSHRRMGRWPPSENAVRPKRACRSPMPSA